MKNSKKKLGSKPYELVGSPNKVRILHMLLNFIPYIFMLGFFYYHNDKYAKQTI